MSVSLTPSLTILMPCFNESKFIVGSVESLLSGNYPKSKIEILVIDGGSTDNTIEKVKLLCERFDSVKLLHNAKKVVPAALNLGVASASNDLLIWCGAHAIYDSDYVKNSVATLLGEQAASSVGGVISPIANSRVGKAIAIATTSKFGIGNAKYRYASTRQLVDTVFGGCFYRANVLKVGGFNEQWIRNQDSEFNHRLRTQIGPIILEPSIRCQYYCRETLRELSSQYFSYGFWRFNTLLAHPSSFTYRQAAPVALCAGLALSFVLLASGWSIGFMLPAVYVSACLTVSFFETLKSRRMIHLVLLPVIFFTLHVSWGLGFIWNSLSTGFLRVFNR